ncbi:MAG: choice-of-anchor D domain-containing protein [Planctomycetes bacterium]|nr:choice-of-anchor D domain-containing protein [Planctomycetota bacterium]
MRNIILSLICLSCFISISCGVKINISEMVVWQGTERISNESGSFNYGIKLPCEIPAYTTFTIENLRAVDLLIDKISVISGDVDDFIVDTSKILSPLPVGALTNFDISFEPSSLGLKSAVVEIINTDKDNNPFTFTVTATAIAPKINVKQGSNDIPNVTGCYDFGIGNIGEMTDAVTFTIENKGVGTLEISDLQLAGINCAEFTLDDSMLENQIEEGESTSFELQFAPISPKDKFAIVSILSNDEGENPYIFSIIGFAGTPEINVKQGITNIPNITGSYDFGEVRVNSSSEPVTFTIVNEGTGKLFITNIEKIGADADNFTLDDSSTASSLDPASETIFIITFNPIVQGPKSLEIRIHNNDIDENPYIFTVTGEALNPEINIKDPAANSIVSETGYYYFGKTDVNTVVSGTFLVENVGYGLLELTGSPIIEISGWGASAFTVTQQPQAFINHGTSTTFKIEFCPSEERNYSATVSIANNDDDEDPYTFEIHGRVKVVGFDFNGDGIEDIIVGTYGNIHSGLRTGKAYIYLGSKNLTPLMLSNSVIGFYGRTNDRNNPYYFGCSASSAGDFNNDGYDDIIIGAAGEDFGGTRAGCAFIFFGSQNPSRSNYALNADVIIIGENENDRFGWGTTSAGDLNNDGIEDIIIGAPGFYEGGYSTGKAYIYYGSSSPTSIIYATNADVMITGVDVGGKFGGCVSSAGDYNNDNIDDIIIGAPYANGQTNRTGVVYIFYGKSNIAANLSASSADVKFNGRQTNEEFGYSVSSAGDFNNDGIDDIIIGAWHDYENATWAGAAFVYYGSSSPISIEYPRNADIRILGENAYDGFAISVSNAGDFNNDGLDDILISTHCDDSGGNDVGAAFVFYGKSNHYSMYSKGDADFIVLGENYREWFGFCSSSAGDLNSDGIDDFIIGAFKTNDNGIDSGSAFIFYGKSNPISPVNASNANIKLIGNNSKEMFGYCVFGGR